MGDEEEPRRFRVIEGGDEPKPYHEGPEMRQVVCRRCEDDTGVAYGGPWFKLTASLWEQAGHIVETGEEAYYCPQCLLRRKEFARVLI